MKKIFTFIVALVATTFAMAQGPSEMNFIGNSTYSATIYGQTITGGAVKDIIVIADANSSVTLPSMTVNMMGTLMTVPSVKYADLKYTMEGNPMMGNATFTWEKNDYEFVTDIPEVGPKTIKVTSLKVVYAHKTGELKADVVFTYGSMPGAIHFTETGYFTKDNAWGLVGRGTEDNPYKIYEAADFYAMAEKCTAENTGAGESFLVMNDIDFGGSAESPAQLPGIAKAAITNVNTVAWGFDGIFDGAGHSISGIYHTNNANDAAGKYNAIFSSLGGRAKIGNLVFAKNNYVSSYNYVAPFVSMCNGEMEDLVNYADITASNAFVAGICGSIIKANGKLERCKNYGKITSTLSYAAGIIGTSQSGSSVGTTDAAYEDVMVWQCENYGEISAPTGAGGIAGSFSGVIEECVNEGAVSVTNQYAGGIVGMMSYIGGCTGNVNKGSVTGGKKVGGIIGNVGKGGNEDFDVSNNTNEGQVTGTTAVGDIFGYTDRTILGDANGDGEITVTDIVATANHILGSTPTAFNKSSADSNADGDITVTDIVVDAQIILGSAAE